MNNSCSNNIELLSHAFSSISFTHVYKEANKVAHDLAKIYIPVSVSEQVWLGNVPPQLFSCIQSDLLSAFD